MRIYEYACEACGKQFDKRRREDERDTSTPCPDCGGNSTRNAFAMAEQARAAKSQKAPPLRIMDFECEGCGNKPDRIIDEDLGQTNDNQSCGICDAHLRPVFSARISRESERYPDHANFDPGAGRTFRNAAERRAWMRAEGVQEAGGFDQVQRSIQASIARQEAGDAAARKAVAEDMDRYQHDPDPEVRKFFGELPKLLAERSVTVDGRTTNATMFGQ